MVGDELDELSPTLRMYVKVGLGSLKLIHGRSKTGREADPPASVPSYVVRRSGSATGAAAPIALGW